MHLLIVAATDQELAPLAPTLGAAASSDTTLRTRRYQRAGHRIDLLATGIGMVATAFWCSRAMCATRYDVALNLGVCGSFDPALPLLSGVHVRTDRFSEMGAEDGDRFLSMPELKLLDENEFPYQSGRLVNGRPPERLIAGLPSVDGITVNTVHGHDRTIASVVERFKPQVESMEGAAFMYACLVHDLPFAQVRVVSNFVERRNRAAWRLTEAIAALGETAAAILTRL